MSSDKEIPRRTEASLRAAALAAPRDCRGTSPVDGEAQAIGEDAQFQPSRRVGSHLELADLFAAAVEMARDLLAGNVLAEANLDYATDGPFDAATAEGDGDEPA